MFKYRGSVYVVLKDCVDRKLSHEEHFLCGGTVSDINEGIAVMLFTNKRDARYVLFRLAESANLSLVRAMYHGDFYYCVIANMANFEDFGLSEVEVLV